MKKAMSLVLAVLMLVGLLSACGGSKTPASSSGDAAKLDYPKKDVQIIIPYAPGGGSDNLVRGMMQYLDLGATTVAINVEGASGYIGALQGFNSKNDGYTIMTHNEMDLISYSMSGQATVDLYKDLEYICDVVTDYNLLCTSPSTGWTTAQEVIDYVNANPGTVTVADTGSGAAPHLAYLAMVQDLGLELKTVSYDSAADSVVAVVSGEVQAAITASGAAVGQMDGGNIVPLAVTSNERLSTYPDVPAMGELYDELADMQVNSWIMLAVSADTDPAIVEFLQQPFAPAAVSDAYKATQEGFFFQPVEEMSNEEMLSFVSSQHDYYTSLIG